MAGSWTQPSPSLESHLCPTAAAIPTRRSRTGRPARQRSPTPCICVPYIYVYVELPRSNHAPTGTSCRFSTDPGLWDGPVVWTLPDGIGGRCNVVSGAGTGVPRDCRLMFVLQCR